MAKEPMPHLLYSFFRIGKKSITFVQGITTGFFTNPYSQGLYKTTL